MTSEDDQLARETAILSHAKDRWQKVAMVIANAADSLDDWPKMTDAIADRYRLDIVRLVDEGKLEAQGDLGLPRFSEVRLRHKC